MDITNINPIDKLKVKMAEDIDAIMKDCIDYQTILERKLAATLRKLVPYHLHELVEKTGHTVFELHLNDTKLTVQEVEAVLDFINGNLKADDKLSSTTRMAMKNGLVEHGLMVQGCIEATETPSRQIRELGPVPMQSLLNVLAEMKNK